MMSKITITTTSFARYDKGPLELLKANGFKVVLNPHKRKLKKKEILELCGDAEGIIAGTESLDAEVIGKLSELKVISRCGSGLDNVDRNAAKKKGIMIFNTPDAPTRAVSELTVGLILNALREIPAMHGSILDERWEKIMGHLLFGKKMGIVGFGRIGRNVAELLKPFGCQIAYTDNAVKGKINGTRYLPFKRLLAWADIISFHVSGKKKIFGADELRIVKKGAWLINTSRGEIIDEEALYRALRNGRLMGAALDVFRNEPYKGPLKKLKNVILTPHVGSYAIEARIEMERECVSNLLRGMGIKVKGG
ncbi:MAG: phosphoglycerate dehydrogenase [Candidatus Omnitrophota bacterium]